jgi:hypothetical protein
MEIVTIKNINILFSSNTVSKLILGNYTGKPLGSTYKLYTI